MLHPWVGQIRLKRNVFKTLFTSSWDGRVGALGGKRPLAEATAELSSALARMRLATE